MSLLIRLACWSWIDVYVQYLTEVGVDERKYMSTVNYNLFW